MSLYVIWCIQAQFSQIAPITEYQWNRYSLTHRGLWHYSKVSFDVKKGAEDFGLLFMCPCTWFGVFGPNFPKLTQHPSTCETATAQPTEGIDTRVWFDVKQGAEDFGFLFVRLCTWFMGVWDLFPQIALMPKYSKNRYNSIARWSCQKRKTSVDVKCGAEDYGLL